MVWASLTPSRLFFQTITPPYPPVDRRWADHAWAHKYSGTLGHSFLLLITFLGYLVAKINPKVSSLLMSKLPAEKLASTSSFLGLMVSFAMPLGTALFF